MVEQDNTASAQYYEMCVAWRKKLFCLNLIPRTELPKYTTQTQVVKKINKNVLVEMRKEVFWFRMMRFKINFNERIFFNVIINSCSILHILNGIKLIQIKDKYFFDVILLKQK